MLFEFITKCVLYMMFVWFGCEFLIMINVVVGGGGGTILRW